jgi:hypothetical protein
MKIQETRTCHEISIPLGYKTDSGWANSSGLGGAPRWQHGQRCGGKGTCGQGPGRLRPYLRTKNVFDGGLIWQMYCGCQ